MAVIPVVCARKMVTDLGGNAPKHITVSDIYIEDYSTGRILSERPCVKQIDYSVTTLENPDTLPTMQHDFVMQCRNDKGLLKQWAAAFDGDPRVTVDERAGTFTWRLKHPLALDLESQNTYEGLLKNFFVKMETQLPDYYAKRVQQAIAVELDLALDKGRRDGRQEGRIY